MPTVTLHLAPASISENGGSSKITASLSAPSSATTTVTVSPASLGDSTTGDYSLSGATLTIEPSATTSTAALTLSAVDNGVDAPDKKVPVSAMATNSLGVSGPASVTLTITDDEGMPSVTLHLAPASISENGGSSKITASLSAPSSAITTVTVSASPVGDSTTGDYTLSGATLTIEPAATTSAAALTVSAIDNGVDAPDKTVSISGAATNALSVTDPAAVTLTITDDEGVPSVTLHLAPSSISENGGSANVTASLSGPSSQEVTLTVAASPVSPAVSGDFTITSNKTLTIAAGSTTSTGAVTITGVDNKVDAPDKSVAVSATVSGSDGVSAPSSQTLTITDDEATPTVTLNLSSSSISENGGSANVTASLSAPSSQAVTVVASASPVSPAVSGDFTLTSNKTLTIAPGSTTSTGAVTITGVDNKVDAPDKSVAVSATVSGSDGVSAPSSQTLTITDDEATPTVTLNLSSSRISENGGSANVTASLSAPSSQAVTVVASVSPVSPAVSGYFTITSNKTLTIAPGSTTSKGTVTITGVDNGVDAPNKKVSVSATATNSLGVSGPASVTLTIIDDEATPTVTLSLNSSSISEDGGAANVVASLSGPSSQAVTLTVSATPVSSTVSGYFTITSNKTLTIAAGSTTSTGAVTITGVDNGVHAPDKFVIVWATVSGDNGVSAPAYVTLTITEDEAALGPRGLPATPRLAASNGGLHPEGAFGVPNPQGETGRYLSVR